MTAGHAQDISSIASSTRDSVYPPASSSLRVFVTVWDLLPAGKLSSFAYYAGIGVYHSAVAIEGVGIECVRLTPLPRVLR